ncbi:PSP1 domain-containing protein [Maribellus sediminis]|uniref:PSP1 domain-containing protein n=1 Tax=Maribellus sediminis TaxID=2696285 RepID=UPI00143134F3|nr:regulatory iron-sulfur-containing complex subunit RicT [Maribellus sediminis]
MSCNGCSFNNSTTSGGYDWLSDLPDTTDKSDIVEVKFKSTRKEYFKNIENLPIKRGDKVVVATSPGHDVGEVSLTGYLAEKQFKLRIKNPSRYTLNPVYRKANEGDIEKLEEARGREKQTMIRARQAAAELGLDMKIGDVEFRGDNKKAIFYYIAEGRVDFRELIKIYARDFRIKVEMKQIGARQEAGLVGGIGSCGRELCCSSWRTDFDSISSDAALKQGLSPSAQKMAGACGKLKCCLLYELDAYVEAGNEFPRELLDLELAAGIAKPFKTDYLKKEIWYMLDGSIGNTFNLSLKEVKNIIQKNKRGIRPEVDTFANKAKESDKTESGIVTLDDDLDRFNKKQKRDNINNKNRRSNNRGRNNRNRNQNQVQNQGQAQANAQDPNTNQAKNQGNNSNRNRNRKPKFRVEKKNE